MMFPTISRRSFVTGMMKSRRTLYTNQKKRPNQQTRHILSTRGRILSYRVPVRAMSGWVLETRGSNVPFLARGDAPHTMQLIQYRLQTCQNRTIELDRKRALQARLMLRLFEQILQFKKLDLQMQLPIYYHVNIRPRLPQNDENGQEQSTYIAMNSSTELFSLLGSNGVSSLGLSSSIAEVSDGFSGRNELDATRRVYSQPIFRQNL